MKRQTPETPRGRAKQRFARSLVFWLLALVVPALAVHQFQRYRHHAPAELSWTEFESHLVAGNVSAATVVGGESIEGDLVRRVRRDGRARSTFQTVLPYASSPALLRRLSEAGVDVSAKRSPPRIGFILVQVLPWLLLLALWIWMIRANRRGQTSELADFGRSGARGVETSRPEVTFSDVAGADEAKHELSEIVDFLRSPERFRRLGGRLPKGVLLVGPPGTGKTLLARAVAGEADASFLSCSAPEFVEMIVGVGASRVRDLFERARAAAPCIVFIDEIDAVGRRRSVGLGGGSDEREQTLNQLLVEMDGFEAHSGVILLAATNRADVLDPALLRPGRFDRQVSVDAPDIRGREAILRVHARQVPLHEDVALKQVATQTPGMSGADLANVVNEAALIAARAGRENVRMDDFRSATDKVMLGTERRSMVLSEHERRLTAYHEAGHAVVSLALPILDPLHKVSIIPRGQALGITASLPEEDRHAYSRDWLEARLAMLFGGRAAEEIIFGENKITTGAGNDIERATDLARRMVTQYGMSGAVGLIALESEPGTAHPELRPFSERLAECADAEIKRILDEAASRARLLLEAHMTLLIQLAGELLMSETLDHDDVARIAASHLSTASTTTLPSPFGVR